MTPTQSELTRHCSQAPPGDELACVRNLCLTFNVVTRVLEEQFAPHGLTGPQFGVLKILSFAGGEGLAMSEISDILCVSRPNITGLTDKLHGRGLIERVGAADRRQVRARITEAGRKLLGDVAPPVQSRVVEMLSCLSAAERATLTDLLSRWRNHVAGAHAEESVEQRSVEQRA